MTQDTMKSGFARHLPVLALLGGAAHTLAVGPASAGELCVTCADPAAVYRCSIEGDAPGTPTETGLQLYCIKELASSKGHKSCSVDRTRKDPCEGSLVTLVRPAGGSGPVAAPDPAPDPAGNAPAGTQPVAAPAPSPKQPPATVEALAKETAEQSKKDWETTNAKLKESTQAVGGAVKKSWDCLVSLFARC